MRENESSFVSADPPPQGWLSKLIGLLFPAKVQTVRKGSVEPARIYTEIPSHVWAFRDRAKEAKMLLSRYVEDRPTTRRAWMAAGHSDQSWRRARRMLLHAGVIDRDGRLLWTARDAKNKLDVYLARIERKCWESGRYVAP
jgi:hypothetical protein